MAEYPANIFVAVLGRLKRLARRIIGTQKFKNEDCKTANIVYSITQ